MTPEFEPAVREAVAIYREVCGPTLLAVYVRGSVHRGEAVLGLSDLDMDGYTTAALEPGARERFFATCDARLTPWAPAGRGVGYPRPPDWLVGEWPEASQEARAQAILRWCAAWEAGMRPDAAAVERARYEIARA